MSDRLLESWTRAPSIVDRRNADLPLRKDPPPTPWAGRALSQVQPVLATDADGQGRKGKDWLDGSGLRPRGGPPAQVDLTAPTLDVWEVADSIARIVIARGPTRLAPLTRSLPRDVSASPAQLWPCDERASDSASKPLAKARVFRSKLRARLIHDRCGLRILIACERLETPATYEPKAQPSRFGRLTAFAGAPAAAGSSRRSINTVTPRERAIRRCSRVHCVMPSRADKSSFAHQLPDFGITARLVQLSATAATRLTMTHIPRHAHSTPPRPGPTDPPHANGERTRA